jgi:hypothetical protein
MAAACLALLPNVGFSDTFSRLEDGYDFFSRLHPREEGLPGETAAIDAIVSFLKAEGVPFVIQDFHEPVSGYSFSSSIVATIAGAVGSSAMAGSSVEGSGELVIAVPLDAEPDAPAGSDGSYGLALALRLVARYAGTRPPQTLVFAFLGAERPYATGEHRGDYPMGSRNFIAGLSTPPGAVIYLDLDSPPATLAVRNGGAGLVTPFWLYQSTVAAARTAGLPFSGRPDDGPLYRLRLNGDPTAIEPYLEARIPAITIACGTVGAATEASVGNWGKFLDGILFSVGKGFPATWDSHYITLPFPGSQLLLGEGFSVKLILAIILAVVFYLIVYSLVSRVRMKRRAEAFLLRGGWELPLLAVVLFAVLVASTFGIGLLRSAKGPGFRWQDRYADFLYLKTLVSFLFFVIAFDLLKKLPLSRNTDFYSIAATVVYGIDVVFFSFVDISFSFYFIWAFLFSVLFGKTYNRILAPLIFIASQAFFIYPSLSQLREPEFSLVGGILFSTWKGNLVLAMLLLPTMLMVIRIDYLFFHPVKRRKRITMMSLKIIIAVISAVLVLSIAGVPARVLPAPAAKATPGSMELSVSSDRFLKRKSLHFTIIAPRRPRSMSFSLVSTGSTVVYDSSFPWELRESGGGDRIDLAIGVNPPTPLSIDITVPAGFTGTAKAVASFPPLGGARTGTTLDQVIPIE